ncbi:MAG: ATP-binding protein, partial [Bacteriovoracaceae bacterium]|nr:ATP-binding protein [Bacteriovoracaceae bacterium]
MATRVGTISVETENIFPIIQKWLYSEHDIFLRELVANGTDAITKRAIYARTKNMEIPEGQVDVTVYRKDKKITITDNGIGMTEEEVERYIAQIAFSGASEFIEKMKSAANKDDIIGKFGLGFFSSFMVSNLVEIDTLSVKEGAQPVHWSCDGTTQYTFSDSMRKEVGTTITLHIKEESAEFLDSYKVTEILRKFCDFMPHTITVYDADYRQDEIEANKKKKE